MKKISVAIAEDNDYYFRGLVSIIEEREEMELTGAARDGAALLESMARSAADVVLMDIQMPRLDGIEATKAISADYPQSKVIGLTMYSSPTQIVRMLEAGARGYLEKNTRIDRLIEAIGAVNDGNYYHCPSTTMRLSQLIASSKAKLGKEAVHFNEEEVALIRLICEEYSYKQIASELGLSESSVSKQRRKLQEKMGVVSTPGIVMYAMRKGIYTSR